MSELDKVELRNYENEKAELVRANSSGLSEKIPFIRFYENNVDSHLKPVPSEDRSIGVQNPFVESHKADVENNINRLSGQVAGSASETDDEKKKRTETNTVAAVVAMQDHERFSTQGFQTKQDFFDFGKNLENDQYWKYLQDNPDERKKVADNFYGGLSEQLNSGKMNVHEVMETLTPRAIELGEGSEKAKALAQDLEQYRDQMTPQERQQHDALKASSQSAEIGSDRSEARVELRNVEVSAVLTQQVNSDANALKADNAQVATASINNEFADFANLPGVKTAAAELQKSKMHDGELAKNEITEEQATAQLAAAKVQDKGEVQSAEPQVIAGVQAPTGPTRTA